MTVNITKPTLGATSGWGTVLNTALDAIVTEVNTLGNGTFAPLRAFRRRDLPGASGLPTVLTSGPTFTTGTANAATVLTGTTQTWDPRDYGVFRYYGANVQVDVNSFAFSNLNGVSLNSANGSAPWAVEFVSDSPKFEIKTKGQGQNYRLAVLSASRWQYASAQALAGPASDGNGYRILVDWTAQTPSRAMRHYRLEMAGGFQFGGLTTAITDTVRAPKPRGLRLMVIGDSFTEPTIQDNTGGLVTNGHEGWAALLGKMLGCSDVWLQGSGGTGFLNPGTGGRVTFRTRLAHDIIAYNPDIVIVAGGCNDANREGATPAYTAAQEQAEVALFMAQLQAGCPQAQVFVLAPFFSRANPWTPGTPSLLRFRDAIKAATPAGFAFVDTLEPPAPTPLTTTLSQSAGPSSGNGADHITTPVSIPRGALIRVGLPTDTNLETKRVTFLAGTGPYTVSVQPNLINTYPSGTTVTVVGGPSYLTGSGTQTAPASDGNCDLMVGPDGTHPTVLGHENMARFIFEQIVDQVPIAP